MNVNPHLQYLSQSQVGQNSNQSPQLAQLQIQQQQQQSLQRQQLLNHLQQSQQSQQQPQGLGPGGNGLGNSSSTPSTTTNPLLAALNGSTLQPQSQQQAQTQGQPQGQTQSGGQGQSQVLGAGGQPNIQLQQLQQLQHLQQLQQQQQLLQSSTGGGVGAGGIGSSIGVGAGAPVSTPGQGGGLQSFLPQVPIIKEVWAHNLEYEFQSLRTFISDKSSSIFITIHQEIPGIVARPVGTFKSSSDYHFQTLRSNSDLLNIIQLSLCVSKLKHKTSQEASPTVIWQFNFLYDLSKEMYNEEHLAMLNQTSQINFQLHMSQGIPHFNFAELIIESGLLLDQSINWISYHGGYDLGFLVSLLTNDSLPVDEREFYWWCTKYFPNFYDLKFMGGQLVKSSNNNNNNNSSTDDKASTKPSIEYLAEELHLLPISPLIRQYFASQSSKSQQQQQQSVQSAAQQMTSTLQAYLAMECYKELLRISNVGDPEILLTPFKGAIWGLSGTNGASLSNTNVPTPAPSVPPPLHHSNISDFESRSGLVHFGRPL